MMSFSAWIAGLAVGAGAFAPALAPEPVVDKIDKWDEGTKTTEFSFSTSDLTKNDWTGHSTLRLVEQGESRVGRVVYDARKSNLGMGGGNFGTVTLEGFYWLDNQFPVAAFFKGFTLETSSDGAAWSKVEWDKEEKGATFAGGNVQWQRLKLTKSGLNARYLRLSMEFVKKSDNWAAHIDTVSLTAR